MNFKLGATRRTFLGTTLTAGSVLVLSGSARAWPSLPEAGASAGQTDGGAQDFRELCGAEDATYVVNLVGAGPSAIWIGGLNVLDGKRRMIVTQSAYHNRLQQAFGGTANGSVAPSALDVAL